MKIQINKNRLEYLLQLFNMDKMELAKQIGLKENKIQDSLNKTTLKKIDKIFAKGLNFYTNPNNIDKKTSSSILFRKNNINNHLSIGDIQFITQNEEKINYINSLAKLSHFQPQNNEYELGYFSLNDSPQSVASKIASILPNKSKDDKTFLKNLIARLAEHNILVIEHIESPNKTYKTNICGFFITPNVIILKREKSLKREIFTLLHELGHYLLQQENIDENVFESNKKEEKWCNDFAFYVLTHNISHELNNINPNDIDLKNQTIQNISNKNHISKQAIFYYYANTNKITWDTYRQITKEMQVLALQKSHEQNQKSFISSPKVIFSPLEKNIYKSAYFDGVIDEYDILEHFKPKDNNLDKFLYE